MGALRGGAHRVGTIPRGHPGLVSRGARHLLRRRHPALPQRAHELGVRGVAAAVARVASRGHRAHAPLREGVVRRRGEHARRARRLCRARHAHPRRAAPRPARRGMRRLLPLLLSIAAFVAITIIWVITDRRASERVYDQYSSANTADGGLSQAAAYLAHRGKTDILTRAIGRDPLAPTAGVF